MRRPKSDRDIYSSYVRRDNILKGMKYTSYKSYLRSPLWKDIRLQVLNKFPSCKAECGKPSKQVHHCRYTKENLSGKSMVHLVGICMGCHRFIEYDKEGNKLPPAKVTQRLKELIGRNLMRKLEFLN